MIIPKLDAQGKPGGMMFVGLNPSTKSKLDDVWEDPFGKYFAKMLTEAEIDPQDIWFTDLWKYPTPMNRPLTDIEVREGMEELHWEIGYVSPSIIITLGSQVSQIFKVESWYKLKNWRNTRVYSMYHPTYIKRNPSERKEYIKNLIRIKSLCRKSLEKNG